VVSQNLRIGVLMGGRSIEREVSFNSGRTVCDHLDTQRYTVVPLFQTDTGLLYELPAHFLHRGKIADFYNRLPAEAVKLSWDQLKQRIDFAYIAQHGRYGEDGIMQGMLEVLGIPYLGSKVLGSAIGMEKVTQKEILKSAGIPVPAGIIIHPSDLQTLTTESILTQLATQGVALPIIVKPSHEGSSLGIAVVNLAEDLLTAVKNAALINPEQPQTVLVEEKLEGMEFVCTSLETIKNNNGTITRSWFSLPPTEVVIEENTTFFDYEQKYMPGRASKITPARCTEETTQNIMLTCQKAAIALGFSTLARIDGFVTTDGSVVIIDPNTLTGMAPSTFLFNQAAEIGMSHTDLINFLIENELHAYKLLDDTAQKLHGEDMQNTVNDKKIRVAVLMGGDSNEREVSLESGRNVCYKLSPVKYEVLPIFVNEHMELFQIPQKLLIKNSTRLIAANIDPEMRLEWSDLPAKTDFVFIGLHGGKGENGAVQGALEMLDLPYNGPGVLASALCMDKFKTNTFLRGKGFAVPNSTLLEKSSWQAIDAKSKVAFVSELLTRHQLSLPLIIKPHDDGCSVMVAKVNTATEMAEAIDMFFTSSKTTVLLEEMIHGTELTVGILGNQNPQALPPSLSVAKAGILTQEEKFLPGAGENQTPAPLPAPILAMVQETVKNAFVALGCTGYSRIDCFYQDATQSPTGTERVVLLEVNTVPALTPATCLFHQAAEIGIKPMDFIDNIIELGFARHAKQINPEAPIIPAQSSLISNDTVAITTEPEIFAIEEESASLDVFKPIPEDELHPPVQATPKAAPTKKEAEEQSVSPAIDESFTMKLF
jgi:D-alanine--D-alanine ligase